MNKAMVSGAMMQITKRNMRDRSLGRLLLVAGAGLVLVAVSGCTHQLTKPEAEKIIGESELFTEPVPVTLDLGEMYTDNAKINTKCPTFDNSDIDRWAVYEKFVRVDSHGSKAMVSLTDLGRQSAKVTPYVSHEDDEKCDGQEASWNIATHIDPRILSIQFGFGEDRNYEKFEEATVKFEYFLALPPIGEDLLSDSSKFRKQMDRDMVHRSWISGIPPGSISPFPVGQKFFGGEGEAKLFKSGSHWSVFSMKFFDDDVEKYPNH
jgi:hypothetical protein